MPTRETKPVTFTCEYCGYEKTEEHGPGPIPRYCRACYAEARRHLNKMRVRAHRARQADADPLAQRRPVGRPRTR